MLIPNRYQNNFVSLQKSDEEITTRSALFGLSIKINIKLSDRTTGVQGLANHLFVTNQSREEV